MNQLISSDEIQQLLNQNSDSVIWSQNISSNITLGRKIFQIVALIVFVFVVVFFSLKGGGIKENGFDILSILVTYGLLLSYEITTTHIFATLEYAIYPKFISFEWGLFKRKKVDIPFDDITAINLVEYTDSKYSTIHFGTKKIYNIKKIDFDNNDTRPHITFERIDNGKKVYELLNQLHKLSNRK